MILAIAAVGMSVLVVEAAHPRVHSAGGKLTFRQLARRKGKRPVAGSHKGVAGSAAVDFIRPGISAAAHSRNRVYHRAPKLTAASGCRFR